MLTEHRHEGRRVLIVGGGCAPDASDVTERVGSTIAVRFGREGATLAITDIAKDRAKAALAAAGGNGVAIEADAADATACERAVREAESAMGGLDVVVLNVGVPGGAPIRYQDVDDWDHTVAVNARSHYLTIKACLPGMLERGNGAFVGICSTAAVRSDGRSVSYEASKAAQLAVLRHTAVRYADRGIRAVTVLLGYFDTAMAAAAGNDKDWRNVAAPAGRQGRPADAAALVAYLATDESAYLNGAEIPLDGGVLVQGVERVHARLVGLL
jgi:NAD(P)-dependent dehydrogenase (short-subunit alcohol dehydrogenase family)